MSKVKYTAVIARDESILAFMKREHQSSIFLAHSTPAFRLRFPPLKQLGVCRRWRSKGLLSFLALRRKG